MIQMCGRGQMHSRVTDPFLSAMRLGFLTRPSQYPGVTGLFSGG